MVSLMERPELRRDDVALAARGHPTEVSRHFHKDVGLTLTEYRTRLRLLRFIQLADAARRNLLSAALDAGFGSYSQCHRAFRNTLGCSPRAYFKMGLRAGMEHAFLVNP
jgi:AraC-like DNA-binding protein